MKARIITSLMALAALLAVSCDKEADKGATSQPQQAISINASVSQLTKAVTDGLQTSFVSGDKVSLYVWSDSPTDLPGEEEGWVVKNVTNTFDGTSWVPAKPMLWRYRNTIPPHFFLGIYPERTVESFTADEILDYGDLMVATVLGDGITPPRDVTPDPVDLVFEHVKAKLNINVKYRNQWGGVPEIVFMRPQIKANGTINYLTKTITAKSGSEQILNRQSTAAEGYSATYSGFCLPQEGFRTIKITVRYNDSSVPDETLVYTHPEDIPLEAGKITTISLVVGKDKIVLDDNTVADWDKEDVDEHMDESSAVLADATRPLTLKAVNSSTPIQFSNKSEGAVSYVTSKGRSGSVSAGRNLNLSLAAGERIWFIGDGSNNAFATSETSSLFTIGDKCQIYGNVMSLLGGDFATATTLSNAYTFAGLFKDQVKLVNSDEEGLYLPATTLTENCYKEMFSGCNNLTSIVTSMPKNWVMGQDIPWGVTVYEPDADEAVKVYTTPTALPTSLTYNTAAQTLVTPGVAHKDGVVLEYSLNGTDWTATAQGTNAGNYNVYCRVKDGGVASAALPATINKANPTFSLSATNVSFGSGDAVNATKTVTITYNGDGTLSASSNNTGLVTVSRNNNTLTLTRKNAGSGSCTITVSASAGSNYNAPANKTITVSLTPNIPEGALTGLFSVSASQKVYFSKGNLQLTAANTWRFAPNQYDYFGTSSQYDNHRDLFAWGTGNNPNKTDVDTNGYDTFTDWGSNSSLQSQLGTGWRTLSIDEWEYLLNTRTVNGGTGSGKTYTLGQSVNGKTGLVIYPDGYTGSTYTGSNWSSFEAAGCLFLPAAGCLQVTTGNFYTPIASYWSSSIDSGIKQSHRLSFNESQLLTTPAPAWRYYLLSVRLVKNK